MFTDLIKQQMDQMRKDVCITDQFSKEQLEFLKLDILPKAFENYYNHAANPKEQEILLNECIVMMLVCEKRLSILDLYKDLEEKSKGHK